MRSVAIGVLTAILVAPSTANAWGFEAHKFIVARAIDILPEPLRPFFEANRAFIVERSIDPDLWRNAGFTEEPPNHFLDFDAYGPYPFKDLPREYDEALKKHGIDKLRKTASCRGAHMKCGALIVASRRWRKRAVCAERHPFFLRHHRPLRCRCARAAARGAQLQRPTDRADGHSQPLGG